MYVYECVLLLRCALRLVALGPLSWLLGSAALVRWVRCSADLGPWVLVSLCRNLDFHVAGERDSYCATIARVGHYAVSRIAQWGLACDSLSAVGLLVRIRLGLHLLRQMVTADRCPMMLIATPLPASALRWAGGEWRHGMYLVGFIPWRVWIPWWASASTYQRSGRCIRVGV